MLFHQGGVIGFFGEVLAFQRIGLVVVEFDGLDLIGDARRVGAEVGAAPFDVAVAWRSQCPTHHAILAGVGSHLADRSFVQRCPHLAKQRREAGALQMRWLRQADEITECCSFIMCLKTG